MEASGMQDEATFQRHYERDMKNGDIYIYIYIYIHICVCVKNGYIYIYMCVCVCIPKLDSWNLKSNFQERKKTRSRKLPWNYNNEYIIQIVCHDLGGETESKTILPDS